MVYCTNASRGLLATAETLVSPSGNPPMTLSGLRSNRYAHDIQCVRWPWWLPTQLTHIIEGQRILRSSCCHWNGTLGNELSPFGMIAGNRYCILAVSGNALIQQIYHIFYSSSLFWHPLYCQMPINIPGLSYMQSLVSIKSVKKNSPFYRAKLCVNAVFAVVRLSVRLSRWWIVSTWLKISSNFFLGPITHHSSFYPQRRHQHSDGNPFSRGAKHTGVGKFCDFRQKSPFMSEMVRDRPLVTMER